MLDLISRCALLTLSIVVLIRSVYLVGRVHLLARRIALVSTIPPAVVWAWFYIENLLTIPAAEGGLDGLFVISRVAVFLVMIAFIVQQQVIIYAESATRRIADES